MKQGKRWIALMLALAMCLSVLPASVLATELGSEAETTEVAAPEDTSEAAEVEEPQATETGEPVQEPVEDVSPSTMAVTSGKCGKNAKWSYNSKTKTLTISGKGAMYNYSWDKDPPWADNNQIVEQTRHIVVKEGITRIGNMAFECIGEEGMTRKDGISRSISLPKSLTSIGAYAFASYQFVNTITIPKNVKSIGGRAFSSTGVKKFQVDSENKYFTAQQGVLFNRDKTILVAYPVCNGMKSYTIPSTVEHISGGAFDCGSGGASLIDGCKLRKFVIPYSVETVDEYVFVGIDGEIYFEGNPPKGLSEAFDFVWITIYYPKEYVSNWQSVKKALQEVEDDGDSAFEWKTWTPYEKPDFFVLGKDSNSYKHSSVAFGLSSDKKSCTKYTEDSIGKTYPTALKLYSKLLTGINGIKEEAKLQEDMNEEWGGSCLGLTLSMIMSKNGRLDVSKFRTDKTKGNTKYYYALWPPAQNLELRNLISYYYLLQKVNQFPITQATYNSIWDKRDGLVSGKTNTKWAEFWKNFYKEVKKASDQKKSILFSYKAGDAVHVLLTCGYDDSNPDYMIIKLFDCNTVGAEFSPGNNSHQNVLEKGCYSYIYVSKTSKKFKNDEDFYMVYATPWGNSSYGIEHNNWHFFFYTSLSDLNKIDAADEYYRSPYATKLLSVKSRPSKTIKVTWLKRENVLGYEVQCDTSTKFKNRRSVIIQKENANSTTISNLKKGKKYYVRIRTYKTVSGKTYYSSWSKLKSTIVKK